MSEFIVEIPDNIKRQKGGLFSSAGIEGFPVRNEIIRCRDCGKGTPTVKFGAPVVRCEENRRYVRPSGFCAWAERRYASIS